MSEVAIPVAEAARDFLRVLEHVERKRESAILVPRDGKPVATLNPLPSASLTCAELAERWSGLEKLPPEEANAFADDIERAHTNLPPLKPAWD